MKRSGTSGTMTRKSHSRVSGVTIPRTLVQANDGDEFDDQPLVVPQRGTEDDRIAFQGFHPWLRTFCRYRGRWSSPVHDSFPTRFADRQPSERRADREQFLAIHPVPLFQRRPPQKSERLQDVVLSTEYYGLWSPTTVSAVSRGRGGLLGQPVSELPPIVWYFE